MTHRIFDLAGKRALVCGSTQGIGRACAVLLADMGASVTLLARDRIRLAELAASLPAAAGQRHAFEVADFAVPDQVRTAAANAVAANPIHVLVNNTGGPPGGPIADATPAQFLAAFQAHLICNQYLVQAVVPGMRAASYGRIVNIISTSVKQPIPGLGVSNTIRGAVASWAKTLAGELASSGITVNNVLPGFTTTERLTSLIAGRARTTSTTEDQVAADMRATIPAGRFGTAEEIAAAVAFLASPAASYVNGVNLPVDGGRTQSL